MICTPDITTRGTIVCEGGRGILPAPTNDAAVAHLKTCTGMASIVNDGVCHESKNNEENCWDGGDCCAYSCSLRNGNLLKLADDGRFVYSAECTFVNDADTCFDPAFQSYSLPLTFADKSAETVDNVYSAAATDQTVCGEDDGVGDGNNGMLGLFASKVKEQCGSEGRCSDECFTAVKDAICSLDELSGFAHQCDATTAVEARGCTMPHCVQARTKEGCRCQNSYTYYGETYATGKCINPDEPNEDYDWCAVVPGSCDTATGNPTNAANNLEDDDDAGWWWDACGSGPASTSGGVPALEGDFNDFTQDSVVALVAAVGYTLPSETSATAAPPFPDEVVDPDAEPLTLCCVRGFALNEDGGSCDNSANNSTKSTRSKPSPVDGACPTPYFFAGRGFAARCAAPLPFRCASSEGGVGGGEDSGGNGGGGTAEETSGGQLSGVGRVVFVAAGTILYILI